MSETLILKRIYANHDKASTHINSYFDNYSLYNYSLYDQLKHISQEQIVYYIFFGLLLFAFFHRLAIQPSHILAFFVLLLLLYYSIQKEYGDFIGYTKDKNAQLQFLNTLLMNSSSKWSTHNNQDQLNVKPEVRQSYLHENPYIVQFYYKNREMSFYHIQSFVDSLTHCNNILSLLSHMRNGLKNPFLDYQNAIEESKKCINAFRSIVFQSPEDQKFNASIQTLHELLMGILKEMRMICKNVNKVDGINNHSMPDDALEIHTLIDGNATPLSKAGFNSQYDLY